MIRTFTTFRDWRAAVHARCLAVTVEGAGCEGPTPEDPFLLHVAQDEHGAAHGFGQNHPTNDQYDEIYWEGWLADSADECFAESQRQAAEGQGDCYPDEDPFGEPSPREREVRNYLLRAKHRRDNGRQGEWGLY